MSNKFYIGIAGYMGSGKTICSKIISEKYGFKLIDADLEAKKFMNEDKNIISKLVDAFGNEIIDKNKLCFKKLGQIVFNNLQSLRLLNSIVHPPLIEILKTKIFDKNNSKVILDASLIPLWQIEDWFNLRLWIKADVETRIKRILAKGSELVESEIRKRVIAQMELFKEPPEKMWTYLTNEGSLEEFENKITLLLRKGLSFDIN